MKYFLCRVFLAGVFLLNSSLTHAAEMDELLKQVAERIDEQQLAEQQRLAFFQRNYDEQLALVERAKKELEVLQQQQAQLKESFERNRTDISTLHTTLASQSSELTQLFAFAKQTAQAFNVRLQGMSTNAEFVQRPELLSFADKESVPTLKDLKNLWWVMLQEMIANSSVQLFQAPVINQEGESLVADVWRVGPFAAIDGSGHYLHYNDQSRSLQYFTRQSDAITAQAGQWLKGNSQQLTLDPLQGELFVLASQKPSFEQRLHQGGIVGYIILALGSLGLLVAAWRLLYLVWTKWKIARQLKRSTPSANNPLGRVLLSVQGLVSAEKSELLVDEAILKELPTLERWHSFVKLLAAVAPLLGLLGTVTGMIETFQSITQMGTSDPKLMASGISQALITTVMGLCVAIPLLFCHSFLNDQSRRILQIIQQQSLLMRSQFIDDTPNLSEGTPYTVGENQKPSATVDVDRAALA